MENIAMENINVNVEVTKPVAVKAPKTAVKAIQPKVIKAPVVKAVKVKAEGPRNGSKLEKAVDICKPFVVNGYTKETRLECLRSIMDNLVVSKNNATIYFNKAKAILKVK
jgi:hypothetical protein